MNDEKSAMEMVSILGVDPGKKVGLFSVQITSTPARMDCKHEAIECGMDNALRHAIALMEWNPATVVACERYTITSRTAELSRQPQALEFIGALSSRVSTYPSASFLLQNKSDAVKLGNDPLLRKLGWLTPGLGHANDAARQAILALASLYPDIFDQLLRNMIH